MKEKIMKLSVLVGICAIALFIMVGMASADPRYHIYGVYAVTGLDTCEPTPGMMEGNFTFMHNGSGSMSGFIRRFPNEILPFPVLSINADFDYTVDKEGRIKFDYSKGGGLEVVAVYDQSMTPINVPIMTLNAGPSHGVISPDHKMISISCGPPALLSIIGAPPEAPPMLCITSLVGMRIR